MADVQVTCASCGKTVKLSEFVDRSTAKCRDCGAPLDVPVTPPKHQKPKVRPYVAAEHAAHFEPPPEPSKKEMRKAGRKRQAKLKGKVQHAMIAAVIFVVLGTAAGLCRYGGILPQRYLDFWRLEAIWVFLAFHILILLKAIKESVFQAILCLLVPGYSLYFVFLRCDDFYLRAVVAALLIGGGQDGLELFTEYWQEAIAWVDYMLRWGER